MSILYQLQGEYIYIDYVYVHVCILYIYFALSLSPSVLEFPPPSLPKDVYSLLAVDPPVSWRCGSHNSPSHQRLLEEFSCFYIPCNFTKTKVWLVLSPWFPARDSLSLRQLPHIIPIFQRIPIMIPSTV